MTPQTKAPPVGQIYLAEVERELEPTEKLLKLLPEDKLGWKPHEKSMSLGQLGLHVAAVPGNFAEMLARDPFEFPDDFTPAVPDSKAQVLEAFSGSREKIRSVLGEMSNDDFQSMWRAVKGDVEIVHIPKAAVVRFFILNHWIHHRGQLTVYLRMQGVPLPSVYGPTADENPFL